MTHNNNNLLIFSLLHGTNTQNFRKENKSRKKTVEHLKRLKTEQAHTLLKAAISTRHLG